MTYQSDQTQEMYDFNEERARIKMQVDDYIVEMGESFIEDLRHNQAFIDLISIPIGVGDADDLSVREARTRLDLLHAFICSINEDAIKRIESH